MKIDSSSIIKEYDAKQETYKRLVEHVNYMLHWRIKKENIKIHTITPRIKDINSFLDKIRRKKIVDPFKEIHDLVGFRVVCLFLSDLKDIRNIIKEEFDVFEEDDKVYGDEFSIFGYMTIQLKARLKHSSDNKPNQNIENIPFEIQVRTIAQEAWASISHYLDYKKEIAIPKELKRDFHALSGLFYVADTHFSFIRREQARQLIEKIKK